jgi:Peptidase S24-like
MSEQQPETKLAARLSLFQQYRSEGKSEWIQATGGSMSPLVRHGSWLLVEFGARDARVGEIVVFAAGGELVSHRVIWRRRGELVSKGDANLWLDPPVSRASLLGVVRALRHDPTAAARTAACRGPRAAVIAWVSASAAWAGRLTSLLPDVLGRPSRRLLQRAVNYACRIVGR